MDRRGGQELVGRDDLNDVRADGPCHKHRISVSKAVGDVNHLPVKVSHHPVRREMLGSAVDPRVEHPEDVVCELKGCLQPVRVVSPEAVICEADMSPNACAGGVGVIAP